MVSLFNFIGKRGKPKHLMNLAPDFENPLLIPNYEPVRCCHGDAHLHIMLTRLISYLIVSMSTIKALYCLPAM